MALNRPDEIQAQLLSAALVLAKRDKSNDKTAAEVALAAMVDAEEQQIAGIAWNDVEAFGRVVDRLFAEGSLEVQAYLLMTLGAIADQWGAKLDGRVVAAEL